MSWSLCLCSELNRCVLIFLTALRTIELKAVVTLLHSFDSLPILVYQPFFSSGTL